MLIISSDSLHFYLRLDLRVNLCFYDLSFVVNLKVIMNLCLILTLRLCFGMTDVFIFWHYLASKVIGVHLILVYILFLLLEGSITKICLILPTITHELPIHFITRLTTLFSSSYALEIMNLHRYRVQIVKVTWGTFLFLLLPIFVASTSWLIPSFPVSFSHLLPSKVLNLNFSSKTILW